MEHAEIQQSPKPAVLVVSDDILTRVAIHRLLALRIGDCIVHEARSANAALDMLRRIRPRVIVTDASLPDMQAITLLIKVAYRLPGIRTIIIGRDPGSEPDTLARAAGLVGYLPKEQIRGRLAALVADALATDAASNTDA